MKRLIPFALLLATACSHAASPPSTDDDVAPTTPHVTRISVERPPRWPEDYPSHVLRLPLGSGIAMAAGEEPSADHPAGTVYVLEELSTKQGPTISEWDLTAGVVIRRQHLPFDVDGWPRVLHREAGVHLVASSSAGMYYTLLDRSFHVIARRQLPGLAPGGAALASDGALTFVAGVVRSYDNAPGGIDAYAAIFDARGKRIASRNLGYGPDSLGGSTVLGEIAAVVGGNAYILAFDGPGLRLHELTPELREINSTIVPVGSGAVMGSASVWGHGDHLVVDLPPQKQLEFSLDLTQMREVPRHPPRGPRSLDDAAVDDAGLGGIVECPQSATLGASYAFLCSSYHRDEPSVQFIAWDQMER